MRRITLLFLLIGIGCAPACVPFICIACDSFLSVRGEVYEWLDAPAGAGSVIYLDGMPPNNLQVAPISGVEITLERWPVDGAPHHTRTVKSDHEGHFSVGMAIGPGGFSAIVSAKSAGFREAKRPFRHEGPPHTARVLLVRKTQDSVSANPITPKEDVLIPRDPKRIDRMIELLREGWRLFPGERLTQLVINITDTKHNCGPVYFMDDTEFERRLHDWIVARRRLLEGREKD